MVAGVTRIFLSPSLYLTVTVWPSVPATCSATVALVMVELGSRSQGRKPSATPRIASGKIRIATAFWLPSGCGMAVTAIYELSLISASEAFTTSFTGALSASLIFISAPSRAFAVSIGTLTFSRVARTRTICGAWAAAKEAVKSRATALAPSVLRVIIVIVILPKGCQFTPQAKGLGGWDLKPRSRLRYSGRLGGGRPEIGLGEGPQFRGHFGFFAEPQLKTAHRLMQQHAEPVGGAQAFGLRGFDQWRDQRHIDQIGDNGVAGQSPNIGLEFGLPGHAQRGGVDQQSRVAEQVVQLFPRGDLQTFEEALAQSFGALRRAIDHRDALDTARQQRVDHRVRRAAGPDHDRVVEPALPLRRASVEVVQETFDVGVGRMQKTAGDPQRVGGADRLGALIWQRKRQRLFLVRHRDIGADIIARVERLHKGIEFVRRHRLAAVFAGDAVSLQPIVMNERRARMFDRPSDDASGADGRGHASSTTVLRRMPICGHSTSMVSPGFSHTGGSTFGPFFTGVPVQITSPALSVMNVVV